eukprot:jgi/Tetstr1/454059/TSEL_040978.t1
MRIHLSDITPAGRAAIDREARRLLWSGSGEWTKSPGGGLWTAPAGDGRGLRVYRTRVELTGCSPRRAFHFLTSARGYPVLDPHAREFSTVSREGELGNVIRSVDEFWGIRRDFYTLDRKDNGEMMFTSKSVEDADCLVSGPAKTARLTFALACRPGERGGDTSAVVTLATHVDFGVDAPPLLLDAIACGFVWQLGRRIQRELAGRGNP